MTVLATTQLDLVAARRLLEQDSQRRMSFYAGLVGLVIVALVSFGADEGPAPAPRQATIEAGDASG